MGDMGYMVEFDGVNGYRVDPDGAPRGGVVVIHEIWGLVDHIKSVADRWAAEGYVVVAPDILSMVGMSPLVGQELHSAMMSTDEATRLAAQPRLRDTLAPVHAPDYAAKAVAALRSTVDYLEAVPGVAGRVSVTGFCFGGTYAFALAAADSRVRAAVPFYGTAPGAESIARMGCPVLAIYGSIDESIMSALPEATENFAAAGKDFTPLVFEGVKHAFFNDTGLNYDADAAASAWGRATAFIGAVG